MTLDWRRVAAWFGVLALADAVVVALPLPVVPDAVGAVPPAVVPVLGLVAAGLAGRTLLRARGDSDVERSAPRPTGDDAAPAKAVGADVDRAFAALGPDGTDSEWARADAARTLRSELGRAAREALVAGGHTREEARRLVETGAWTDDPRAAAFLGDPRLPLWMRVRDWASGAALHRRAAAAAEELAALLEQERAGTPGESARWRRPAAPEASPADRRRRRRSALDEELGEPDRDLDPAEPEVEA